MPRNIRENDLPERDILNLAEVCLAALDRAELLSATVAAQKDTIRLGGEEMADLKRERDAARAIVDMVQMILVEYAAGASKASDALEEIQLAIKPVETEKTDD